VLQSRILFKGLQLLKVGGRLSYSTCSLNPVEDEAVVAAALKQFKGCLRLEEVALPGFKFRQGLQDWKVMVDSLGPEVFQEFIRFEDVTPEYIKKRCIKDTMFPAFYDLELRKELSKCLRVFPHDQNTSGFFITIITKIKDFDYNAD
jgi:16S rRNA C967 or C1407 C5-methylase (RsmB/RsmF family)